MNEWKNTYACLGYIKLVFSTVLLANQVGWEPDQIQWLVSMLTLWGNIIGFSSSWVFDQNCEKNWVREWRHHCLMYKGTKVGIPPDFSLETMQQRRNKEKS